MKLMKIIVGARTGRDLEEEREGKKRCMRWLKVFGRELDKEDVQNLENSLKATILAGEVRYACCGLV
jgi:hypothetical protein